MNGEERLPENVPDEVRGLGEPIAFFTSSTGMFALYLTIGILAALAAVGAVVLFVVFLDAPGQGRMPNGIGKLLVVGFFVGGAGIAAITKALTMRGLRVFVCSKGLVRQQRDKIEVLRWDEINKVVIRKNPNSRELSIRTPVQIVLEDDKSREWVFDERLSGLNQLRPLVEEQTLPRMLPTAREALETGELVGFGEVQIDKQGLHYGRKSVAWEEYDGAKAEKEKLLVYGKGSRRPLWRIEAAKVPNAHVLLALTEHARTFRSEPEA